ncbi:hypothetical protein [Telluribacter sp. SYSU D00476]|uniref:TapB family protein n=1 Tax=Telluribacter sp. SYSU D00476 TaxID=2811430 RepID=UPI001FF3A349|nr:hypothetical protein [Telluribacter sp. SYSU D00476]
MKRILLLLGLITMGLELWAQNCLGVSVKEGSGFEMKSYDGKGKENGTLLYKIRNVTAEGGATVMDVEFESLDKKGTSQMKSLYKMRCDGNQLMMDANALVSEEQLRMFRDMQMKFTSNDVVYPGQLSVGQQLKDASLHGEGTSGPIPVTFDMDIKNRKVEGQQKVTVPAGTFDAYKVTSDMAVKTKMGVGMTIEVQSIAYRVPGMLWDVKSETYRRGKLIGYTELSKVF